MARKLTEPDSEKHSERTHPGTCHRESGQRMVSATKLVRRIWWTRTYPHTATWLLLYLFSDRRGVSWFLAWVWKRRLNYGGVFYYQPRQKSVNDKQVLRFR